MSQNIPDVAGFARLREEYRKLKEEKDTLAEQYSHACSGINSANRQCESLQSDLKTAQLNASAAVKLAQDREKELQEARQERDEARECARKGSDLRHAQVEKLESEARRYRKVIDEQKEQLTEKSALCERLQVFVRGIHTLTPRHREKLEELIQRAEGQP